MFPSKIDLWLLLTMSGATILCCALLPHAARKGRASLAALVVACLGMMAGTWAVVSLEYDFEDTSLISRIGPFTTVLLQTDAIDRVEFSRDARSAPASSLDRLAIYHHTGGRAGYTLVSPKDKAGFLAELLARGAPASALGAPDP